MAKHLQKDIDELRNSIEKTNAGRGYYLNPDLTFVDSLLDGLLENEDRYGYQACPCRLASGNKEKDFDLICPCDYRDDDLAEYGACYCALYVNEQIYEGKKEAGPVAERRILPVAKEKPIESWSDLAYPVHRCKVCGYLMAKDHPPTKCPICGVGAERFEVFIVGGK